jgi:hypothetical protein
MKLNIVKLYNKVLMDKSETKIRRSRYEDEKGYKDTQESGGSGSKFIRSQGERKQTSRSPERLTKLYESKEFLDELRRKNKERHEKPSKYLQTIEVPQDTYKRLQFLKSIFAEVDKYYQNIPTLQSLDDLVYRVAQYSKEEIHMYALIFYWISKNVVYDYEASKKGDFTNNEPDAVFKNRKAVCAGFSNLYHHICHKLEMKCKKVTGATKQLTFKLGDKVSSNHAWNCIEYKGQKYLVDSTWGSGYSQNGKYIQEFDPTYFLVFPEVLADSHYPDNVEFLLTKKKMSITEFKNKLRREYSEFYKQVYTKNLALSTHHFAEIQTTEKELYIEIGVFDEKLVYFWELFKDGKKVNNLMKTEYKNDIWSIEISFVANGEYRLALCEITEKKEFVTRYITSNMYWINVNFKEKKVKKTPKQLEEESTKLAQSIKARSAERLRNVQPKYLEPKSTPVAKEKANSPQPAITRIKSKSNLLRLDQMNPSNKFYDNDGAILFEPKIPLLKVGATVKFKVKLKEAIGCAVLDHKTWTYLKHIGDDTYEGAATIQSELVQICAYKPPLVYTEVFEFKAVKS